jgi:hypothetical protein
MIESLKDLIRLPMLSRRVLLGVLACASLFAPRHDLCAADRRLTTSPTTQPWYISVQPYADPTPPDQRAEEPWDPMDVYVESLGWHPGNYSREEALVILLSTNTYAGPLVGGGANRSYQSAAFGVLAEQPDAQAAFAQLYERGQTAGKLYALAAFREFVSREQMSRARFDELAKPLLASRDEIRTQFGCIGKQAPVARLAKGLTDRGEFWSLTHPHSW